MEERSAAVSLACCFEILIRFFVQSILGCRIKPSVFVPQVGAVVEVKNPDGVYQEATINKLTDASIYTVGESMNSPLFKLLVQEVCTELIFTDDLQGLVVYIYKIWSTIYS